jgi:cell division protein ZapA
VEIFGQQFSIAGEAEEAYVRKVAELVDKHMRQVAQGMKTATPHKLAVLAAFNIAHELFEREKKIEQIETDVERRMLLLMESIEEQVPPSAAGR